MSNFERYPRIQELLRGRRFLATNEVSSKHSLARAPPRRAQRQEFFFLPPVVFRLGWRQLATTL